MTDSCYVNDRLVETVLFISVVLIGLKWSAQSQLLLSCWTVGAFHVKKKKKANIIRVMVALVGLHQHRYEEGLRP